MSISKFHIWNLHLRITLDISFQSICTLFNWVTIIVRSMPLVAQVVHVVEIYITRCITSKSCSNNFEIVLLLWYSRIFLWLLMTIARYLVNMLHHRVAKNKLNIWEPSRFWKWSYNGLFDFENKVWDHLIKTQWFPKNFHIFHWEWMEGMLSDRVNVTKQLRFTRIWIPRCLLKS